jgi:hypothetical protein
VRTIFFAAVVVACTAGLASAAPVRIAPVAGSVHHWLPGPSTLCPASPGGSGILPDGDFSRAREPKDGGAFGLAKGTVFAPHWIVTGPRTIDFYGFSVEWTGPNGVCSVDLDGTPGPGGILHDPIRTRIGATYTVAFLFSANGGGGGDPTVKRMTVRVDRSQFMQFSWDTTGGNDANNGDWTLETWQFKAYHAMTSLHFESNDRPRANWGPVVAAISVTRD